MEGGRGWRLGLCRAPAVGIRRGGAVGEGMGREAGRAGRIAGDRREGAEERAALGREHAKSAREYERGVRQTYAHDARRAVPGVLQARQSAAREREIDRSMNRTPRRAPDRGPARDVGPSR